MGAAALKAATAAVAVGGVELYGRSVTARYGLSASAMQSGVRDLVRGGLVREVPEAGGAGVRLVDPFFARWLEVVQRTPAVPVPEGMEKAP